MWKLGRSKLGNDGRVFPSISQMMIAEYGREIKGWVSNAQSLSRPQPRKKGIARAQKHQASAKEHELIERRRMEAKQNMLKRQQKLERR
eukprot:m.282559 g.282559  ORF g.282559 m.282559 type:complete len:89 (-) comp16337_c0_seq83:659-925(-)